MISARVEIVEAAERPDQPTAALRQVASELVVTRVVLDRDHLDLKGGDIEVVENAPLGSFGVDRQVIDAPDAMWLAEQR